MPYVDDPTLMALPRQAHDSLHRLLEYLEVGHWTRRDLLSGRLASSALHRQHARLLSIMARYTGCAQCVAIARRWQRAILRPDTRARVLLARGASGGGQRVLGLYRRAILHVARPQAPAQPRRISIPIHAYPVAGGMRAVLATWRTAMAGSWQMEFLTRFVGPETDGQTIHSFEVQHDKLRLTLTSPAHFPQVWFYDWVGYRKLRHLLRAPSKPSSPSIASRYSAILPQDGLSTAAYASVAARLAGIPVIPVDHGNVHALFNPEWHRELLAPFRNRALPRRFIAGARFRIYWRSLRLLGRLATRLMEHALVASDDIAEAYQQRFHVPAHRITRFPFVVDTNRYAPVGALARTAARAQLGVPDDAIVIVMVNRLAPEKDLETAIAAIHATYTRLPADMQPQLRVIIAGDGPLREQVERELARLGLDSICQLTGEASASQVADLLSLSDIFLYTGRRGINSMAILEAMSAGCAIVGTTSTRHIADYLAEGRGHAVPVGDVAAVSDALHDLVVQSPMRTRAGQLARDYVLRHHTADALRRCLWRVTGWSLDLTTPRLIAVRTMQQEEAAQHEHT
jgi:glycosyltransferase involved in cell wall biosynthesis